MEISPINGFSVARQVGGSIKLINVLSICARSSKHLL